jgi:hypothetical protein
VQLMGGAPIAKTFARRYCPDLRVFDVRRAELQLGH